MDKKLSIFSSDGHFVGQDKMVLCYFGTGHGEEHFCEIILNLDQCHLKIFLFLALVPILLAERNHCAILVECIIMIIRNKLGNIHVRLFYIWTSG